MSEDSPPPQEDPAPKTWHLWVLALVLLSLAFLSLLLPALGNVREKANVTNCHGRLLSLSLTLRSYYSDGTSQDLPILLSGREVKLTDGGFGFDINSLSCRATHRDGKCHYVWNPKLSGGTWAEWNNPNSPLIWDASPHRVDGLVNAVFGDGHVERRDLKSLEGSGR
ncbi:MAG: hypothetical protein RL095_1926 [Verrucomicrobiota bacterium]|jgi:prepilin-type processing-associated H-X9-DG protein